MSQHLKLILNWNYFYLHLKLHKTSVNRNKSKCNYRARPKNSTINKVDDWFFIISLMALFRQSVQIPNKPKLAGEQTICADCGPYGFCIQNTSFPAQSYEHEVYNQSETRKLDVYARASGHTTENSVSGGCLKCACPQQIGGLCCEEVPDICMEVTCPTQSIIPNASNEYQDWSFYSLQSQFDSTIKRVKRANNKSVNIDVESNKGIGEFTCNQLSKAQNFYECSCKEGFSGPECDQAIDFCALCSKYGTISCKSSTNPKDKICKCKEGFIGKFCENKIFEYCEEGECACEEIKDLCENNGFCFYNGTGEYFCRCVHGFAGSNCQEKIPCTSKNLCKHGGICVALNSTHHKCVCPDIWSGKNCQVFNACSTDLCQNNATCVVTGNNMFECDCRGTGFAGDFCEINLDDCLEEVDLTLAHFNNSNLFNDFPNYNYTVNKCQKRDLKAKCVDGVNSYTCICSPEFTGHDCDISITTWSFLRHFPDLTERNLLEFMDLIAENPTLIKQIVPFFTSNEDQSAFSWTHDDIFVWAAFQGQEINVTEEIIKWNDPSFGNCFTFNHIDSPFNYQGSGAGQSNGFEALLRVRQEEYLAWTENAGLILFLHSHDEPIFTDSQRYFAAPNSATQFALSEKVFTRLGGLYGNCVESPSEVHSYYYEGAYTVEGCIQSCYQNAVHLICGCTDPRFPGIKNIDDCTVTDGTCVLNITQTLGDPSQWEACECAAPCNKTDFQVDVRTSRLVNTKQNNGEDTLHISVYFARDYLLVHNELANMDFNRYISFFGGVVGVVAGFSVISVVEFGFLVYRLLLTFCTNESVSLDEAEVQDIDDDIIL